MGRPTLFTDDLALRLAQHLEDGLSIADACSLAGISERTYHDWAKRGAEGDETFAEFAALMNAARARGRRKHLEVIHSAGDWRASAWFLERSDPEHWGRRSTLRAELTSAGGPLLPPAVQLRMLADPRATELATELDALLAADGDEPDGRQ